MVAHTSESNVGDGGDPERLTVQGRDALIARTPDEIRVRWRVGRPVYFEVRVGDLVKNADRDVESPLIEEWEVTEITPETVVGVDVETGDRREWDRRALERGLAVGNFATNLTDFASVAVHRVGAAPGEESQLPHPPYVTVIAYGNNGERYGRRYRFVGDETRLTLRDEDPAVRRLSGDLRATLDERIERALADDGYEVVAVDGGPGADETEIDEME